MKTENFGVEESGVQANRHTKRMIVQSWRIKKYVRFYTTRKMFERIMHNILVANFTYAGIIC